MKTHNRTARPARWWLSGFVLGLVIACGGGGTGPEDPITIADQVYVVALSYASNTCGVNASFPTDTMHVRTNSNAVQLLGLLDEPVPSTRSGARDVVFSAPFPTNHVIKTFSGTWTFTEAGHTFEGDLTYEVVPSGGSACEFVFLASGEHHIEPEIPPPPAPPSTPPSGGESASQSGAPASQGSTVWASAVFSGPVASIQGVTGSTGVVALSEPVLCTAEGGRAILITGILATSDEVSPSFKTYELFQLYRIWRWTQERGWYQYSNQTGPEPARVYGFTEDFLPQYRKVPPQFSSIPGVTIPLQESGYYHVHVQLAWAAYFGGAFLRTGGGAIGNEWLVFDHPSGYSVFGGNAFAQDGWCYIP
jgi:hypothetical protein